jgi:hypothetical protein
MRALLAALVAGAAIGCGGAAPILPTRAPRNFDTYDDGTGRTVVGPSDATISSSAEDVELRYKNGAVLTVSAVGAEGLPFSEGMLENALRAIRGLKGAALEREEVGSALVLCLESGKEVDARGELAACTRTDDALRKQGMILLGTLRAKTAVYRDFGGARLVANALASAQAFRVQKPLPPP